jgi:hypothetical protein
MTGDTPSPSLQGLSPLSQQIRTAQGGQQGGMNPQWDKWFDMVKAAGVTGFSGPKQPSTPYTDEDSARTNNLIQASQSGAAAVPTETPNSGLVPPGLTPTSVTPMAPPSIAGLGPTPGNKRNGSLVGGR